MYQPLVSIIIPVYNGSNFLGEAIDSALAQEYKNLEIIVINDGSKDDGKSEEVALSYGDKIRYLTKENGGVSSALNVAVKQARGEWISWLSHDDLYYPAKIQKQIDYINELINKNGDIDLSRIVLHSATQSIDINRKVIKTPDYSDVSENESVEEVIINNIYNYRLSGCSFLIPKSSFDIIGGFDEKIRTVSDVEFWYRLALNDYKFYCLKNDILVMNRNHGKQVGKTKVELFNNELNDLYTDTFDKFVKKCNPSVGVIKRFYFGLLKRHIYKAAEYVYSTRLKGELSFAEKVFVIPFKRAYWKTVGAMRNALRYVYRKIKVK